MRSRVLTVMLLALAISPLPACGAGEQDTSQPRARNPQIPRDVSPTNDVGASPRDVIGGKGREDSLPKGKR